jgi:hypothetical protein
MRMMKMHTALSTLIFMFASTAFCAELSSVAQQEIAYLFSHMESSGCEFNRNDSWYGAAEASVHIQKKYQYLLRRDLLSSAEDFIIGAASESSISNKPYLVRCPGTPVVESGPWFKSALEKYRQMRAKP